MLRASENIMPRLSSATSIRIGARRVDDRKPLRGAGGNIDIVDADAVLENALELLGAFKRVRRDRDEPCDQKIGFGDMFRHAVIGLRGVDATDQRPALLFNQIRHSAVLAEPGRGGEDRGHADSRPCFSRIARI